jgi:4-amino-4-deoxy-L-arabinose transferase-like glycosyltransferase
VRYGYYFNGLYGQDAHRYYTYSYELSGWLFGNGELGHFVWPVLFPLFGGLLGFIFGHNDLFLQLLSTFGLFLTAYSTYHLYDVKKKKENLKPYFFITLILSPIALKHGVLVMSDMLCLGFVMSAWNFSYQYQKFGSWKSLLLTAFFGALAIMTRYVAAILLIIPLYWTLKTIWKKKQWIYLVVGLGIIILVLTPHYIIKSSATSFLGHSWLQHWNFLNIFKTQFSGIEGHFNYSFPNFIYILFSLFHPLYFILGVVLIFFVKLKKDFKKRWFLWVGLLIYLIFIGGIPYQNKRFLLLAVPFVSMIFVPAFGRFFKLIKERLKMHFVFTILMVFIQLGLFTYSFKNVYQLNKIEKEVATYIEGFPQKDIYGFGIDIALKSYLIDKEFYNLWEKEYVHFKRNSLVVFNEARFSEQWKGKNPMINWETMNEKYELRAIKQFPKGWTLYELR